LIWFLLGAFAAGTIGTFATLSSVATWYPSLNKPAWTPPNGLFGPVWTVLYVAMAVAAWRVWRKAGLRHERGIVLVYALQLALNAGWSVLFFGLRAPGVALLDILALWLVLVSMLVTFVHADRIAGALWLAYTAWVSFATALNAAVWSLNRPA
jgi:tryptophan-rich sensory protein